jgi:hypothetical protein
LRRFKLRLALAGAVLLLALLTACQAENTANPTGAAAIATPLPAVNTHHLQKADLAYPGAQWLSEKEIWPEGRPADYQAELLESFLTGDSWPAVLTFYTKQLTALGFQVGPNYTCSELGICRDTYAFEAFLEECLNNSCAATYQLNFLLVSGQASPEQRRLFNWPNHLNTFLKPDRTFVSFSSSGYRPLTVPDGPPTTAALVETATPSPRK